MFPKVRIGDDVRAQHKLLTVKDGLKSLALVVGGSMGAQQTYEWAVRYPDFVWRSASIAGTAKNTRARFRLHRDTFRCDHIRSSVATAASTVRPPMSPPAFIRHAKLWTVMGWSTEFFREGRHKALGFDFMQAFVDTFMTGYFAPMDPNDLLAMAWKWQRGDVSRNTGDDLASALVSIKAKTYVMPISHDMFFPPSDCEVEQRLIPGSQFRPLKSICGHLGLFGVDPELARAD